MTAPRPPRPRRTFAALAGFLLLDSLALGLILPVLPRLIGALGPAGPGKVALAYGLIAASFSLMQVFAAPVLGALSDTRGRRPILVVSNLVLAMDFTIMALAPGLGWVVAGRLLSGAASGNTAAAFAYLADISPPSARGRRFGLLFAAQAVGAALGPALGGGLSAIDLRAPFWAAAVLALANALFAAALLPESLPRAQRAPFTRAAIHPLGAIAWILRTYPALAWLVAAAFLLSLASQGANSVAVLYATYRFGWAPAACGLLLTAFGVTSLLAQALLAGPAERRLGPRRVLLGGLGLTAAGLALMGAAARGDVFAAATPLIALGALSGPMLATVFSGALPEAEQGRLQGAWAAINGLMGLAAPLLFTFVFATAVRAAPHALLGAPFFLASALVAASIPIAGRRRRSIAAEQR